MTPSATRIATALRAAAAAAALAAAWGPRAGAARDPDVRIVAWDASASVGGATPSAVDVARAMEGLPGSARGAVVVFGEDARVVAPLAPARGLERALRPQSVSPHASSLAAALRTAAGIRAEAGAEARAEVVLASDARATDTSEELLAAASALRAAGGATIRLDERPAAALVSFVAELRGPGRVRAGEPFALEARGSAPAGGAVVSLLRAGAVVETRRVAGPFRVAFARIEDEPGLAVYRASLPGAVPPASSHVLVASPGTALVLSRDALPWPSASVVRTFSAARDDAALAVHDLVVVSDASAADLDGGVTEALARHARAGGGVLLLGGPHAFAAGGWAGHAVEELSPLRARPPQDGGVAVLLAIDASGSMGESWPGTTLRRDAAVGAAAAAFAARAGSDVRIAVRRFRARVLSGDVRPVFHGGAPEERRALDAELRAAPDPAGSTALLPVLDDAAALLGSRAEKRRRIVLFSDGQSAEDTRHLHAALERLRGAGVDVTLVVPGAGGEGPLFDAAKRLGVTIAPAQAPEQLDAALRTVERDLRGNDPFAGAATLRPAAGAQPLFPALAREGSGAVPRRNRAWLADGATPLLVTPDGDVVAAQRTLGAGRVTAVAVDAASLGAANLLRDVARLAARPAADEVRVERSADGGLVVRLRGAQGRVLRCRFEADGRVLGESPLRAAGDGLLAAAVPRAAEPSLVRILDERGREITAAGLDTAAPPEYRDPPRADLALVSAAAAPPRGPDGTPLRPWLAGASALLLVAAAAVKSLPLRAR